MTFANGRRNIKSRENKTVFYCLFFYSTTGERRLERWTDIRI
nr:MAG TPA: hypothetical protein [Caudoviricetes sp.]